MTKYTWVMDQIENMVIVTRVIDSGEVDEDDQPILKTSRVARDNGFDALNEIRYSLDVLEKELKKQEPQEKEPEKPKIVVTAK